ncbi:MAG: hypothetical protein ACI9UK_000232, partial [Candidatus Krumholzibacteriia bacterium]
MEAPIGHSEKGLLPVPGTATVATRCQTASG